MSTKPISNAPESMQKWSRWVDKQIEELGEGAVPAIKTKLARMDANDIRYQEQIAALEYQLKYLSDLIKNSQDFSSLQSTLNNSKSIDTVSAPATSTITPSTSTTLVFTASGSASWAGTNLITGNGTYTDAGMMYQGPAAGSQKTASFWFSPTDLAKVAGKTITSASIYIKNRHFYYNSGGTVELATHAFQVATRPTTSNTANSFNQLFKYGEGKWIDLNSTVYNGIKNGTITGFSIGVGSAAESIGDYSYFDGAKKSMPPQLRITYTT